VRQRAWEGPTTPKLDGVSAQAGWYPDPGGVPNLYRYWDGQAWSAATSPHPQAPPPAQGLVQGLTQPAASARGATGPNPSGPGGYGYGQGQPSAYADFQTTQQRKSPVGWWIAAAALLVVIIVIAVIAVRAIGGGAGLAGGGGGGSQPSQDVCPTSTAAPSTAGQPDPTDGRVHGGPVSYPRLGDPWSPPEPDNRVPFGTDVQKQWVMDQASYDGSRSWVASVLVAELMAGDGFYTPEQGAQIVVRCILGEFYGDNPVTSNVQVNKATTIDGHDAWLVESQLSFDIPGLIAKGELLIVAVVSAGESGTAGLYYASIPDTQPDLVQPARDALADLHVDG
jgi:hypothetical protein